MRYLAHRSEDQREQTVLAHLEGTAELCARFAAAFGAEEQGRLAGLAHDIGKYSAAFQQRLNGATHSTDHATAGAFECFKRRQAPAALSVAGHHGGLPDGGSRTDGPDQSTFCGRMNRARMGKLPPYDAWAQELSLPPTPLPRRFSCQAEEMFFTRMLYSCLVDADFLDTEAFMDGAPGLRGSGDAVTELEQKLLSHICGWFPPKTPLNAQRCAILKRCLDEGERRQPGLFSLTVPTGGGKTAASLAFALRHARQCGLTRIIYVLPYTSIIEQNADVFRDILGAQNVLEHHSGVQYDMEEHASPDAVRLAKATENWDMPVVVTTAVQFFESLYANRSSRCRKLHNLAGSVIIFDEAQMLPLPYLRPCVFAIAQLVRDYRASAVLCTATQPALEPVFQEFLPEKPLVELCPPDTYDPAIFRRVVFRRVGFWTRQALSDALNGCRQALCIVNKRKSAQAVYKLLQKEGSFHLSTLMCPAHRKAILAEIRERLKNGMPCRVVSTSLIEAGVDVDFPMVFREEAGLDSILQAAGRCNREGKLPVETSVVTIFESEDAPPPLLRANIAAGKAAMDRFPQIDSAQAVACYFHELLDIKGAEGQDKEGILPMMEHSATAMPFCRVAECFHIIDQKTLPVYIPWKEGAALTAQLIEGHRSRQLLRQLGQYSTSVYPEHFSALDSAGALTRLEDGCAVLSDLSHYSEETGLSLDVEGGQGWFA